MKHQRRPWIIAHRGARKEAPENSLTAFHKALDYAIDGIEFDVQMSSDGLAVLYHDRTLRKLGGGGKRIAHAHSADLGKLDWGGWFHRRFRGEPIPTLDKALAMSRPCRWLCIEIKSHPAEQAGGYISRLAKKVVSLVNASEINGLKERIMILSFDRKVLAEARDLDPDIRYVLNVPEDEVLAAAAADKWLWGVGIRIGRLSPPAAQWVRQRNLHLLTYTCNGPRQVRKAVQLDVDGIITDRPGWLVKQLERY